MLSEDDENENEDEDEDEDEDDNDEENGIFLVNLLYAVFIFLFH